MGLLSLFKSAPAPVARVNIHFQDDFEKTSKVSILVDGLIPDGTEIWIWDLYYAKTLFTLGRCGVADGLKNQLEEWSEERAIASVTKLPIPPAVDKLDPDLVLVRRSLTECETYGIEVLEPGRAGWPTIQTHFPSAGFQNRLAYSVLALAQHFLDTDRQFFRRELPMHVMAMRKYYADSSHYSKAASVLGAPVHAMKTASDLFHEINRSRA